MNFVFLSPHFPPQYYWFSTNLNKLGVNVLGLADEPFDILNPQLKEALKEYYRVPDMHDYDQLLRALGYFTHRYGKIDRIDSLNEYWLETEARLRTDFNIPGLKSEQIDAAKRKSEMKKVFQKAGINVSRGMIVRTIADAQQFIEAVGYPVVAKPDIGVGAAKTYRIDDANGLKFFEKDRLSVDYFFEEFVEGIIQSFDGLTDRDGNIVFYTAHQYSQGIMETVNADDDIYYFSLRQIPPDLHAAGVATVKAFDIRERFFHIEYFRTPENRIVALEVNLRPPGGFTTDMFNYANDIDIYSEWAQIIVNNRFTAQYSRPYHCAYVGRKQSKQYKYSIDEIKQRFSPQIMHAESVSGIFSQALGNFGFLVRSPNLTEIIAIANEIQAKVSSA
jgi:hypothetical protein